MTLEDRIRRILMFSNSNPCYGLEELYVQVLCNPHRNPNVILHRNRKTF